MNCSSNVVNSCSAFFVVVVAFVELNDDSEISNFEVVLSLSIDNSVRKHTHFCIRTYNHIKKSAYGLWFCFFLSLLPTVTECCTQTILTSTHIYIYIFMSLHTELTPGR